MKDSIKITEYDAWMQEQVIQLFVDEYKFDFNVFKNFFIEFYEHEYQQGRAIMVAAVDEKKVVGFQAYFYWPYRFQDKVYNSFQSGNSLVHSGYRGRKIFSRLLKHIQSLIEQRNVDFLVGFPVQASYGSFIRKGWKNILNMRYMVKINNLFSIFFPLNENKIDLTFGASFSEAIYAKNVFRLNHNSQFEKWRKGFRPEAKYYTFSYEEKGEVMQIEMKLRVRKKIVKELLIGDIRRTTDDSGFINRGLRQFLRDLKKLRFISFVSLILNFDSKTDLLNQLKDVGFFPQKKQFYFIIKPIKENPEYLDASKWEMFYNDMDVW